MRTFARPHRAASRRLRAVSLQGAPLALQEGPVAATQPQREATVPKEKGHPGRSASSLTRTRERRMKLEFSINLDSRNVVGGHQS
jgi:hypothetical protein